MTLLVHRRDEIEKKIFRFFSECRTPDVRNIVTESSFLERLVMFLREKTGGRLTLNGFAAVIQGMYRQF
jgi:hypothetical protein